MDLNLIIEEYGSRDPPSLIVQKIKLASSLGYRTVALTVKLQPDKTSVPEPPSFRVDDPSMNIVTRLTIQMEDTGSFYKLSQSPNLKRFDILAIEPMDERIMNQFCGGQLDCDILCLTMSTRLVVDLKRANLALPASRGICFEINYGEALIGSNARINLFSASQLLIEKSRGKNIIISSGTKVSNHLRAPHDVANLGLLFGLKENLSKEAVFKKGQLVLRHCESRRNACSRAVKIEPISFE